MRLSCKEIYNIIIFEIQGYYHISFRQYFINKNSRSKVTQIFYVSP